MTSRHEQAAALTLVLISLVAAASYRQSAAPAPSRLTFAFELRAQVGPPMELSDAIDPGASSHVRFRVGG